jgi:cytochrome c oxidase subunit 2
MKPTITTAEMRNKLGDSNFDYILLCNKVCGAAHFNMQMKIVVETEEEYNAWLAAQKEVKAPETEEEGDSAGAESEKKDTVTTAMKP